MHSLILYSHTYSYKYTYEACCFGCIMSFGIKSIHHHMGATASEAVLPGLVFEIMLHQKFLLAFWTTVTLRLGNLPSH